MSMSPWYCWFCHKKPKEKLVMEVEGFPICDDCYDSNCKSCHKVPINNAEDELCGECQAGKADYQEER